MRAERHAGMQFSRALIRQSAPSEPKTVSFDSEAHLSPEFSHTSQQVSDSETRTKSPQRSDSPDPRELVLDRGEKQFAELRV